MAGVCTEQAGCIGPMELFKNTNFDFLGWKWPFIGASLVLSVLGIGSLVVKGGPKYGIDFNGGALMYLRFNTEPPVQRIRTALADKIQRGDFGATDLRETRSAGRYRD